MDKRHLNVLGFLLTLGTAFVVGGFMGANILAATTLNDPDLLWAMFVKAMAIWVLLGSPAVALFVYTWE